MRYTITATTFLMVIFWNTGFCETPQQRAQRLSLEGALQYDKGNYLEAARKYEEAFKLVEDPALALGAAKSYEAGGRLDKALQWVKRGLALKPTGDILLRLKSKLQVLTKRLSQVKLEVITEPPGVRVLIDGRERGTTPLSGIVLKPGHHILRLVKKGFAPIEQEISFKGGEEPSMRFKLTPIVGWLTLDTTPSSAQVFIDGKPVGRGSLKEIPISAGLHLVEARLPGYTVHQKRLKVLPGRHYTLLLELKKVEKPWYHSWPGWLALGVGLALGGAGGYELYRSRNLRQEVDDALASPVVIASQKELDDKLKRADLHEKIGYSLIGGGIAGAITSVVLFVYRVGVKERTATPAHVELFPSPGGVGVFGSF